MQGGKITLRVQYNFAVVGMLYRGKMNHCYSSRRKKKGGETGYDENSSTIELVTNNRFSHLPGTVVSTETHTKPSTHNSREFLRVEGDQYISISIDVP